MSRDFSWNTDDEEGWHDLLPPTNPHPRGRFWQWLLVLSAAAILISALIYARLQQQIRAATTRTEQDILSAHELSQLAAANQDLDLFRTNLSPLDLISTELVAQGLFLDRPAFDLEYLPTTSLPITITLAPDLLLAELRYEQEYRLTTDPSGPTIRLRQTAIYQRGGTRWLRANPLPDFWGETAEQPETYLTVQYPQRDQVMALRLAQDLDEQLATLCRTFPTLDCSADLHLTLQLSPNAKTFFTLTDLEAIIRNDQVLVLPAPTLIGLPLDEAGYQAILRGYSVPLVSLAIARLTDYDCCERFIFFRAFLDKELSQLNLQPWPLLTAESYAQIRPDILPIMISRLWNREQIEDEQEWLYVYSLVEFLTAKFSPHTEITEWQKADIAAVNYWEWLGAAAGPIQNRLIFNTELMQFVQEQSQRTLLPIPFPAGALHLNCDADEGYSSASFQYQFQTGRWSNLSLASSLFQPATDGYVAEQFTDESHTIVFVQNDEPTVITTTQRTDVFFTGTLSYLRYLGNPTPANRFHFMSYSPLNLLRVPQNWLVNLDECATGACSPRPLPGVPIFWSPGNQHIIIYRDFSGNDPTANIFLAAGHGENVRPVATGYQPFWLDNDHFGYFQPNSATGIVDMMFGDVHTGESVLGLSHTELVPLIDDGPADASYFMTWAVARPQSDHQLSLLIIQDRGVTSRYLILNLQWDTGWQQVLDAEIVYDETVLAVPAFSPDGRFQVFTEANQTNAQLVVRSMDTQEEQVYRLRVNTGAFFNFPQWSEDSRWLMYASEADILLVAPEEAYEWRIPHAYSNCVQFFYRPAPE